MNYKKIVSLVTVFSMCALLLGYSPVCYAEELQDEDEITEEVEEPVVVDNRIIPSGFLIEGTDISGMTVTEAYGVVNDYFSKYDDVVFTLNANGKSIEARGEDIALCAKNADVVEKAVTYGTYGNIIERYMANEDLDHHRVHKNYKLEVSADIAGVKDYLQIVKEQLDIDPVNGKMTRSNGEFTFIPGEDGICIQVSSSAANIVEFISTAWDGEDASIDLTTEVTSPKGTAEELAEIKDLLGTFSTDYHTSSANRKTNVANGCRLINGQLLYPGEELSVTKLVVPFSAENGYALAGSYENGTTVETYGGGICQVSTTLYGAIRNAEVEIVTRAAHSMIVSYVEPSMDAAISEGAKDFQIRNNKDYPIYIEGKTDGNKITFNVFGKETRDPGHKVEYVSEITSQTDYVTEYVAVGDQPIGFAKKMNSGHTGYTAVLWKIVTEDGVEVSRKEYNHSKYNVSNEVIAVGTMTGNPAAADAINSAIATQDGTIIANAMNAWAGQ